MGMALFYLKARFPSAAKAREVADLALPRFEDIDRLMRDWNRVREDCGTPVKDRYNWLVVKHPLAAEFLPPDSSILQMDPMMNFIGHIVPDVEPGVVDFDLMVEGDILFLKSWGWQHSDWDNIVPWLINHGAKKVGWVNSEDRGVNPGPKDWKPGGAVTPFDKIHV